MNKTAPIQRRQTYVVVILSLAFAGLLAGRNVATWPVRLLYPGEECGSEGMQLEEAVRLRTGARIFAAASPERFEGAVYGPLYYLLTSRIIDPRRPAFLPLRLLSLIGTLGCAAGCALLAFWLSRSYFGALLASLIFLAYGFVSRYGISARCDLVALLLAFSGFLVAYRFRSDRRLLWAIPLMLCGFFYKQQFVAGPLAVLLYLLLEKSYRKAWEFLALLALGGLALLALFQFVVFHGQAFLTHVVLYNMLPFSWTLFRQLVFVFSVVLVIPLWLGIQFLRAHPSKLLGCYLGCAVILSVAMVGKEGSDVNYFLECALVLSALAAAFVTEGISDPARLGTALLGLVLTVFAAQWPAYKAPKPGDFARDLAMQNYLRQHFPPHTPAFGLFTGDLIRSGLDVPVSDLWVYTWLVRTGRIPEDGLLTELHQRNFGVILVNYDLESGQRRGYLQDYMLTRVQQAIRANYRVATTLEMPEPEKIEPADRFYIWVPRESSLVITGDSPAK